jgi:hypothetical protein
MAVRHFTLTVGAVAQRLSDVYGDGAGVVNAEHDLPYRQILLQSEEAAVTAYIGEATVSTTDYGVAVPSAAVTPPVVSIGPFETGPVKLSQLYAVGGADLHILAIPF